MPYVVISLCMQLCVHSKFFFQTAIFAICPTTNFGHSRGDSLTNPMVITAFAQFRPKSHWELRMNEDAFPKT